MSGALHRSVGERHYASIYQFTSSAIPDMSELR
jgi:hypothetical protein